VNTSANDANSGDFRELLAVLGRRTPLIILAILVGMGAGFLVAKSQQEKYEATASLLFRAPKLDLQITGFPLQFPGNADREALTNLNLVSLDIVRQRAATMLGADQSSEELKKNVEIESEGKSDIVQITASEPSGPEAALVANTLAKAFIAYRKEALDERLIAAATAIKRNYRRLSPAAQRTREARQLRLGLEKLRLLRAVPTNEAELAQPASVPSSPASPDPAKSAAIGGLLGLAIGLALALLVEHLDRRVRRSEQIEDAFGMPVLARIPRSRMLGLSAVRKNGAWGRQPGNPETEPFRRLWASLRYEGGETGLGSALVTSSDMASGKTTVALRLAAAAASGSRVLLLEAELRHPQISTVLDITDKPGLVDVLRKGRTVSEEDVATVLQPPAEQGGGRQNVAFDVLVAGEPSPGAGELLDSESMRRVLEWAQSSYEFVVIDAPSPGLVSDSIPLMRQVDGVIVVGRVGRDSVGELSRLRLDLDKLRVEVVGVVANFVRGARGRRYSVSRG
jgi:polysaccharide biosynthesis transport protein